MLIILYFDVGIIPDLASSHWLLCPFDASPSVVEHFLLSDTMRWSRHVYFLHPSLRSSHFSKETSFFSEEWYLEAEIWALDVLIVPGVPLPLVPQETGLGKACVCNLHVYTHTCPHVFLRTMISHRCLQLQPNTPGCTPASPYLYLLPLTVRRLVPIVLSILCPFAPSPRV